MQLNLFEDEPTVGEDFTGDLLLCPECNESKPTSEYYMPESGRTNIHGARRKCKTCYNTNQSLVYQLKKENPYPHKDPTCSCCGTKSSSEVLNLDHCHASKVFRGWLCRSCNTGIGSLGDNIQGLRRALTYLRKHYEQH